MEYNFSRQHLRPFDISFILIWVDYFCSAPSYEYKIRLYRYDFINCLEENRWYSSTTILPFDWLYILEWTKYNTMFPWCGTLPSRHTEFGNIVFQFPFQLNTWNISLMELMTNDRLYFWCCYIKPHYTWNVNHLISIQWKWSVIYHAIFCRGIEYIAIMFHYIW